METALFGAFITLCVIGMSILAVSTGVSIVEILHVLEDPEAFQQFKREAESSIEQ